MDKLLIIAIIILIFHFSIPLMYYYYLKLRWLDKPWNIKFDYNYTPEITIIIPTYNEATLIAKRLNNIYKQDYPKEKIKIIVIDSASTDDTPNIVEKWKNLHNDIDVILIREYERRGKLYSVINVLNNYLHPNSDVVILTDADAFWDPKTLKNLVKYFGDPHVGVVTGSIKYIGNKENIENIYRNYYNNMRIGESKIHSTPIHNGPLQAFRTNIIKTIGLPSFPGADDSSFGSYIAFAGFRAIQADDVWVYEIIRGNTIKRKIRRAQHIILNFLLTKRHSKKRGVYKKSIFEIIWRIEWFLTIINPWLLLMGTLILILSAIHKNFLAIILLALGLILIITMRNPRMWILQQIYLILGFLRNLITRSETWSR